MRLPDVSADLGGDAAEYLVTVRAAVAHRKKPAGWRPAEYAMTKATAVACLATLERQYAAGDRLCLDWFEWGLIRGEVARFVLNRSESSMMLAYRVGLLLDAAAKADPVAGPTGCNGRRNGRGRLRNPRIWRPTGRLPPGTGRSARRPGCGYEESENRVPEDAGCKNRRADAACPRRIAAVVLVVDAVRRQPPRDRRRTGPRVLRVRQPRTGEAGREEIPAGRRA